MGVVYLAKDLKTGDFVAVKTPSENSPKFYKMLSSEAGIMKRLQNSPHIPVVIDDGPGYIAMEWIQGDALDIRFQSANCSERLESFFEAMPGVCNGIHHAHANGILHLDLKPSNVMITRNKNGSPTGKVLDFGIAMECSSFKQSEQSKVSARKRMPFNDHLATELQQHPIRIFTSKLNGPGLFLTPQRIPAVRLKNQELRIYEGAFTDKQSNLHLLETPNRMPINGPVFTDILSNPESLLTPEDPVPIVNLTRPELGAFSSFPKQINRIVGTLAYMSPEMAAGDFKSVSPQSDIYEIGGIMYEAATGNPPNEGISLQQVLRTDRKWPQKFPSDFNKTQRDAFDDFLKETARALARNPKERHADCRELSEKLSRIAERLVEQPQVQIHGTLVKQDPVAILKLSQGFTQMQSTKINLRKPA